LDNEQMFDPVILIVRFNYFSMNKI